jgi:hypothetical protein
VTHSCTEVAHCLPVFLRRSPFCASWGPFSQFEILWRPFFVLPGRRSKGAQRPAASQWRHLLPVFPSFGGRSSCSIRVPSETAVPPAPRRQRRPCRSHWELRAGRREGEEGRKEGGGRGMARTMPCTGIEGDKGHALGPHLLIAETVHRTKGIE